MTVSPSLVRRKTRYNLIDFAAYGTTIKFVVFESRFDFPRTYILLFISSTAKVSVRPISNNSTVPATRRDMMSEAD